MYDRRLAPALPAFTSRLHSTVNCSIAYVSKNRRLYPPANETVTTANDLSVLDTHTYQNTMIQLSSAGKHFGSKTLFEGLNWVVSNGERVGLVGGNGTGKSTLLKMLAGWKVPTRATSPSSKGTTTGYLPQDGLYAFRAHGAGRMPLRFRPPAGNRKGDGNAHASDGGDRSEER